MTTKMPKIVGFSPQASIIKEGMVVPTSLISHIETSTEVQLKRARMQIQQLKAENIRLRRKVKVGKGDESASLAGSASPGHKSIESSLCAMQPSPATSVSPMPIKRKPRKKKQLSTQPEIVIEPQQPSAATTTVRKSLKSKRPKKVKAKAAAMQHSQENIAEALTLDDKKTMYRKCADAVKDQIKKEASALKRRGDKNLHRTLKTIKEHHV